MLAAALALGLSLASPGAADPGVLVLGPADAQSVEVLDASGQRVATVAVHPDRAARLHLPAGRYRVQKPGGPALSGARVAPARETIPILPGQRAASTARVPSPREPSRGARASEPTMEPQTAARPTRWKRWGAPLLSTLIPGLGQAINRQPGKAAGVFSGTVGLGLGAYVLWRAGDRSHGANLGSGGPSPGQEIVRLGALSSMTTAFGLLYLGQIMDAHATARGRPAEPLEDYKVSVHFTRASTVGMRPGRPAYALYDDWTVSLMGQVIPRLTVGLADVTLKFSPQHDQLTMQAGLRSMYRFFDRRRVWLSAGGGVILQGTSVRRPDRSLQPGEDARRVDRRFGAVIYAQLELRWFLLDRLSLDLFPRVSLPITHRDYRPGQKIPRLATTFELGAGVGVHF